MKVRTWILGCTIASARPDAVQTIRKLDFKVAQIVAVHHSHGSGLIHLGEKEGVAFDGYELLPRLKEWCRDNCTARYASIRQYYHFAFESDADAMMFAMVWGSP